MNKKFKTLAVIVMVLSILTSLSFTTLAAEATDESPLTFELNEDGASYTVAGCDTNATGLVDVPETYNGLPVTSIGAFAFGERHKIESINLPTQIETIGLQAFVECLNLTSITIGNNPNGVGEKYFVIDGVLFSKEDTYPANNGFEYNFDYNTLVYYPSAKSSTTYTIPTNTMAIGPFAFTCTSNLNTVIIPSTVQNFYLSSFHNYPIYPMAATTFVFQHDTFPRDVDHAFCYLPEGSKIIVKNESLHNEFTTNYGSYFLETSSTPTTIEVASIPSTALELNAAEISLELNETSVIIPTQQPVVNTDSITFTSSDENVVSLDKFTSTFVSNDATIVTEYGPTGRITANGLGTAIITVKSGSITKTVTVTVTCSHKNTETVEAKTATCTEDGYTAGVRCVDCGASVSGYEKIAATGHNTTLNVTWKPDCINKGSGNYVCTICNTKISTASIPALGHSTEWIVIKEATCSTDGQEVEYCSRCGRQLSYRAIAKTNNCTFTEWVTDTQSTCNQQGVQHRTCTQCGKVETTENPATSKHQYSDWTIDTQPTCTTNGSKSRYCTVCGYRSEVTTINALGHTTSLINAKNATCTADGYTGDTYCSTCKQTITKGSAIAKLGHAYNSGVVTAQPSCANTGVKTFTCTRCNGTKTEAIAKVAHKAVTLNAVAPTCTQAGLTQGSKCSVCNTVLTAQQTIAATGHKTSVINAKAATCTAEGYTGDTQCTVCKAITAKGSVIAKTAHKTTVVGATQATLVADGYTGDTQCTVCKTVTAKGSVIPKLVLNAPVISSAKATTNGIEITWTSVPHAAQYKVYRKTYNASTKKWDSKWKKLKTITGTEYVDGTVVLGTKYKYLIKAVNGDVTKNSEATSALKYNVKPTVKIKNTASGVKVTWTKAANATGYTVYRSQYSNGKWSSWKNMGTAKAEKSAWTDKSAKSGVTYRYTVRACYNKVKSSYTASNTVVFLTQPTVKIANASTGIKVSWNKVSGATGYTVYRSQYANGAWTKWQSMGTAKANKKSWVDKSVVSDGVYKYTVRAVNGSQKSSYKGTGALTFLAQPTVKAAKASNGIKVTWNSIAGAQSYKVYRAQYNTSTKKWSGWKAISTANASQTVWTDTSAKSGVTYRYTVRAVDGNCMSSYAASNNVKR